MECKSLNLRALSHSSEHENIDVLSFIVHIHVVVYNCNSNMFNMVSNHKNVYKNNHALKVSDYVLGRTFS